MKTWTNEEVQILQANYNIATNSQLSAMLPSKTPHAIYKKAYKMGLRKSKEIECRNRSEANRGEKSGNWNNGVRYTHQGYKQILLPHHPRADSCGYVMEHIVVFENATGIEVPRNCCIHHINGDKTDNRIENLCLMLHGAHTAMHNTGRVPSEKTRMKISERAKERSATAAKSDHPAYKKVDMAEALRLANEGLTVAKVCEKFGICKRTYYNKLEEMKNA